MTDEIPDVGRRALIGGGLAVVLGAGAAACSSPSSPATAGPPSTGPAPDAAASTPPPAAVSPSVEASPSASGATPSRAVGAPAVLQTPGADIRRATGSAPAVALTFHGAGDPALTRRALAILRAHGSHVTVFAVGTWLSANPDLGRAIVAGGHDLGNHTWSHQTLPRLSASAARSEISRGAAAVAAVEGAATYLFRPSGTPTSTATIRAAARASGYERCISFDVDPADYQDPGTRAVVSRTLDAVRAGSIVSLHLGHPGTVDALEAILAGLDSRGLAPVTVTTLLA
ncbi:MAG: polysaccharide deacetylase [Humibacillus sp.]|nr:polysaccharide deacetylase [Humibacillus sp.]